jgi:hypothetical protein
MRRSLRADRGDLKAAGTFMRAVAALDRYHGLTIRASARRKTLVSRAT